MTSTSGRRAGLSNTQHLSGLLKNIPGRRHNGVDITPINSAKGMPLKEPEDVTAPPVSSDEESDLAPPREASSDSDNVRQRNADIKPSFAIKRAGAKPSHFINSKKSSRDSAQSSSIHADSAKGSQPDEFPSSSGSKRSFEDDISEAGSHMTDDRGFIRNKKVRAGYGNKPKIRVPKKIHSIPRDSSPARSKFQTHKTSPSPAKQAVSKRAFRKGSFTSSATSTPAKCRFKDVPVTFSPEKPNTKFVAHKADSTDDPEANGHPTRVQRELRSGKSCRKNGKPSPVKEDSPEPDSPLAKFVLHHLDEYNDADESRAPLSTQQLGLRFDDDGGLRSDSSLSDIGSEVEETTKEVRCPMCHEIVDPDLLKKYTTGGRMNVRKQAAFCRSHKRKEAHVVRKTKGYPEVRWDELEARLTKHSGLLQDILEGRHSSHYASLLSEKIEAGENRTLLKTDEDLVPGYYGPRGVRVMTDFVLKTFADTIRKRAVEDRLVSARGHAAYVQAVLVPELAIRLIMEDMNVSEEDARRIMSDSSDLGELVHEEARDVVRWSDDENEG